MEETPDEGCLSSLPSLSFVAQVVSKPSLKGTAQLSYNVETLLKLTLHPLAMWFSSWVNDVYMITANCDRTHTIRIYVLTYIVPDSE